MPISLLFSGHMVDLPDRKEPRFPPSLEDAVKKRIAASISRYARLKGVAEFASAARGADIIFHEQCRANGIPTTIIIPFSPEKFVAESIEGVSDQDWERRFWEIWEETAEDKRVAMVLNASDEAYQLCNMKLVKQAEAYGIIHLIAFWDGKTGDGRGGTEGLVTLASEASTCEIFTPESLV